MPRRSRIALSSLLLFAACAGSPDPSGTPGDPGNPGAPQAAETTDDQQATGLAMLVMSRDATGAPRLMRSFAPRPGPAGMSASQAALDHMAALAPLYVNQAEPLPLVEKGVQALRNGATVVRLAQESDGVVVHSGEIHLLLHPDQSLAAVSGTLLPGLAKQTFTSTADAAVGHALDELFGKSRATPAITVLGDRGGWSELSVAAGPGIRVTKTRARKEIGIFGGEATAMWAVEILGDAPAGTARDPSMRVPMARRLLVGDADGRILGNTNLIQSES